MILIKNFYDEAMGMFQKVFWLPTQLINLEENLYRLN
ncbi:MAG: hypothetical protein Pg6B_01650 [Candidatus Azobacteroides pseudotrichonymphae]|nr:MAG: hypothetical protein Pg6B_01650 [Candidatus Azobacteroides pseudotrichonymphae]